MSAQQFIFRKNMKVQIHQYARASSLNFKILPDIGMNLQKTDSSRILRMGRTNVFTSLYA